MAWETTTALAPLRLATARLTAGASRQVPSTEVMRQTLAWSSRGAWITLATSRTSTGAPEAEVTVTMPASAAPERVRPATTSTACPSWRRPPAGKLRFACRRASVRAPRVTPRAAMRAGSGSMRISSGRPPTMKVRPTSSTLATSVRSFPAISWRAWSVQRAASPGLGDRVRTTVGTSLIPRVWISGSGIPAGMRS